MNRRTLLLGALLAIPGLLDALPGQLDVNAWEGDERVAVLGLCIVRPRTTTCEERITALAAWLRDRRIRPLGVMLPALEALVEAPPMTFEQLLALAAELELAEVP